MILAVGQRWEFQNGEGLNYISEVTQMEPKIRLRVVQFICPDKRGYTKSVGEIFTPSWLKIDNSTKNVTKNSGTFSDGTYCQYTYLYGQDAPNKEP